MEICHLFTDWLHLGNLHLFTSQIHRGPHCIVPSENKECQNNATGRVLLDDKRDSGFQAYYCEYWLTAAKM